MTAAVVGAGPSGLLAAILLAKSGESVRLFDEQERVGGHLTYDRYRLSADGKDSTDLVNELESVLLRSGAVVNLNSVVWAAYRTNAGIELSVNRKGAQESVQCGRVIFATGTTDRAISAPGSSLPGVMTARAARILGERHGVVPGERFAIIGTGAHSERLARDIGGWGARVEAIVDANSVRRIVGQDCVQAIETDNSAADVDVVVIAAGELPDLQLPGMVGVERVFDTTLGGWRARMQSGPSDVLVAGGAVLGRAWISDVLKTSIDAVTRAIGPVDPDMFPDLVRAIIADGGERER